MTRPHADFSRLPFPADWIELSLNETTGIRVAVPENPDAVLNRITDEEYNKDRFLPYWTEQWPSTAPLVDFLTRIELPDTWSLCELGCGLGSITAAVSSITPLFAVATDIALEGCRFAAFNIKTNSACQRVVCSDWRHSPFKGQFDAVIASDVLYEERWIDPVVDNVNVLLKPGGRAWIADPCRRFWPLFKNRVAECGLRQKVVRRVPVNDGTLTVEILEITR
jgi:SAM-dependent methyltransferase